MIFGFTQDNVRCFCQIASGKMRFLPQCLRVPAIYENCPATGGIATIHVAPAIADHPALRKINAEFAGGAQQHAGLRFATITIGCTFTGVITNPDAVNRQPPAHFGVNGFHDFPLERPATNIRLVGHDHEQKTGLFKTMACCRDFRKNFKFT